MTEPAVKEVVKEEPKQEEVVEFTEVEQAAYKEGWRPEEEFKGPKEKWIPAKEYMDRKPLFERIDDLKSDSYMTRKELQDTKKTLNSLIDHHKRVRETEYKRAMEELRAQRRLALEDGDHAAVDAIESKIEETKSEKVEFDTKIAAEQQVAPQPTPQFTTWVRDNSWYTSDTRMHDYADAVAAGYLRQNPNTAPEQLFEHVTKEVKEFFSDKFAPPSRRAARPSQVDSGGNESRPSPRGKDDYKLSPVEEEVARGFEKRGVMTREQYIKELKKLG